MLEVEDLGTSGLRLFSSEVFRIVRKTHFGTAEYCMSLSLCTVWVTGGVMQVFPRGGRVSVCTFLMMILLCVGVMTASYLKTRIESNLDALCEAHFKLGSVSNITFA